MRKAGLMMLLAIMSNSAVAKLVEIGSDESITIYADLSTIRRVANKVTMWEVGDFKMANKSGGKSFISMRKQQEYDCKENKIRTLHITLYSDNMGRGEAIHTGNKPRDWEPVAPNSYGDFLLRTACGARR